MTHILRVCGQDELEGLNSAVVCEWNGEFTHTVRNQLGAGQKYGPISDLSEEDLDGEPVNLIVYATEAGNFFEFEATRMDGEKLLRVYK
jgi:hypothetical protein